MEWMRDGIGSRGNAASPGVVEKSQTRNRMGWDYYVRGWDGIRGWDGGMGLDGIGYGTGQRMG